MKNTVTLYSNGIGHFRRSYKVSKDGTKLSIPFKTDCIGDVMASLQVFGKVRLDSPPSYTPANSTSTSLNINQTEALKSLLRQLSGAAIRLKKTSTSESGDYILVGTDTADRAGFVFGGGGSSSSQEDYVVLMNDRGEISRVRFDSIDDVRFTDESVRTEIGKALKTNFQKIKPDSTLLDISLSAEADTEAVVQYTIPVASWKMRYSLVERNGKYTLEGAAVIDNNTDEDWQNFQISVVTGNPVSFMTDIANVVMPKRAMVNLIEGQAIGNVDVDVAEAVSGRQLSGGITRGNAKFALAACASPSANYVSTQSFSNRSQYGMDEEEYEADSPEEALEKALTSGVDAKEVGDFCIFTSKDDLTILARKSAIVNMFSVEVPNAGLVLFYKEQNHARRPFRAVKFKNDTDYSLGRGTILIYNGDVLAGECILEASKPGENRLLPHCVENSVRIIKTTKNTQSRRSAIKISEGVAYEEYSSTAVSEYEVENKKDESFKVVLEHNYAISAESTQIYLEGVSVKDTEKIVGSFGQRLYFDLEPKQKLTFTVTEVNVQSGSVALSDDRWIRGAIIDTKNPLGDDAAIKKCMDTQVKIDDVQAQINDLQERKQELIEQAERTRANLEAAGDAAKDHVGSWVKDLNDNEKEIRQIDKTDIPALKKEQTTLRAELKKNLKKITVSWSEAKEEPKKKK